MTYQNTVSFFFDGTSNGPRAKHPSNVYKLYNYVPDCSDYKSRTIYLAGPGASEYDVIAGNLLGVGIWDNIKKAYRFMTAIFNETPDIKFRIMIFGFSRGAYTAHLFSWLLNNCGIPTDIRHCDEYVEMFQDMKYDELSHISDKARTMLHSIEMLGVWDVVKSVVPDNNYFDGQLPTIVKNVYHAMSLDELREKFPVLKWEDRSNSDVHQIWFAGVHSDIGGGYAGTGLSDISLRWMYRNAVNHGLLVDKTIESTFRENILQIPPNDPFKDDPGWNLMAKIPRIIENEPAHPSVNARILGGIDYKPEASNFTPDVKFSEDS